jgi:hypothetical protein
VKYFWLKRISSKKIANAKESLNNGSTLKICPISIKNMEGRKKNPLNVENVRK